MRSTFRILFFVRWELKKADGKVPIHTRLTLDGDKVRFNLKTEVSAKLWDRRPAKPSAKPKRPFR